MKSKQSPGYGLIVEPGKQDIEFDTFSCCHCNKIVRMYPGDDICGCYRCGYQRICDACEKLGTCRPFEKWLDQVERPR